MPMTNSKVELKLKWRKHCVLSVGINDNTDADSDNIIFPVKDTKLYIPLVTLLAKDSEKPSNS